MPKFPEPPPPTVLAALGPALSVWPANTPMMRVYSRGGPYPSTWDSFRSFGPTNGRFDHHLPPARLQSRAVLYSAHNGTTCLAEVFQDTRVIDRVRRQPTLVAFAPTRELQLLDLTGAWPTRAGASMVIGSGMRGRARRWSQAFYDAFPDIDGLLYCSSMHANQPCVALYERAQDAMPPHPTFHRALVDPAMLQVVRNAAHSLGYGLQ
jgi:hypothetical protein